MARLYDPSTGECRLVDDIDFSPAEQTVRFHLDGLHYEIALAKANMEKLRAQLQLYMRFGHVVARDDVRKTRPMPEPDPDEKGASL